MHRCSVAVLVSALVLSALVDKSDAAPGDFLFKITAPDPQPGAAFGYVVSAVDGDILVGELLRDPGLGIDVRGAAYLFDGQTGKYLQTFKIPEPMPGDLFASSLAGGDGRVFISARGVPSRVYAFDAKSGEHLHTIHEPTPQHGSFGASLAYGNGSVLVSSVAFDIPFGPQNIGRADLFDAATGQLHHPLPNPEPKPGDSFGTSVSIFGNRALVGAIDDDLPNDGRPDGDNPGRVWVFNRSTGEPVFTLENPNPQTIAPFFLPDWFGHSVAVNNAVIAVSAQEEDAHNIDNAGAVYLFDNQSGALMHTLTSPHLGERSNFGNSLAMTPGGDVLIGSFGDSVNGIPGRGHVYLFDSISGSLLLDIPNPEPDRISGFGFTVAATDHRIFVGSPIGEAVYVFEAIPEPGSLALVGSLLVMACAVGAHRTLNKLAIRRIKARGSP